MHRTDQSDTSNTTAFAHQICSGGRIHPQNIATAGSSFGEMTWVVGNVRITRVVEFVMPFPVDFFAEATPEDVAAEAGI